jgi:hypothetical protein
MKSTTRRHGAYGGICGQSFAYAREVEEERQKKLVKTRAKRLPEKSYSG